MVANKKKILIVDEHPVFRHGLVELINSQLDLYTCGVFDNPRETLKAIPSLNPDLLLVGFSIKAGMGLEFIKTLHALYPKIPLLTISVMDEIFYAERSIRAGAKGYIMKHETTEKFLSGIRQVLKGEICLSSHMINKLLANLTSHHRTQAKKNNGSYDLVESLSDRELGVFELIGQGYSTTRIAKQLHLSVKTIETYRRNIKEKLNIRDTVELFKYAHNWISLEKSF